MINKLLEIKLRKFRLPNKTVRRAYFLSHAKANIFMRAIHQVRPYPCAYMQRLPRGYKVMWMDAV